MKCLLVDDEDLALDLLADFALQVPDLEVIQRCDSALQALEILKTEPIDLVFLDIQMPYLTGIEFLETLENCPATIITSSYSEYAVDGYRFNVVDYLLKPFSPLRFLQAVDKAREHILMRRNNSIIRTEDIEQKVEESFIYIKSDYRLIKLDLNDILYIEGLKQYVKIFTTQKCFITIESLKNLENMLPGTKFLRIHKSFIVSLQKVNSFSGSSFRIGDKKIPLGRLYKESIRPLIKNFENRG